MGKISGLTAGRPFLDVTVNSIKAPWLYDTGASVTCMALSEFRKIAPDSRPNKMPTDLTLVSAAKTQIKVVGKYLLQFNIFGKLFSHPVYVCSLMNQKGIIGMDIIKRLGLTYLPTRHQFIFEPHLEVNHEHTFQTKTVFKSSAGVVAALLLDRKTIIPPHTQKVVNLQCTPHSAAGTAAGATAVANIFSSEFPLLWGGPALVQTNFKSKT